MRLIISATAFVVPLLLVVAIGSCFADPTGSDAATVLPSMPRRELDELYRFVTSNAVLLDHYAPAPGQPTVNGMPHLALDRFDRRGVDTAGQAWYRLAQPPGNVSCGVLRRTTIASAIGDIDGHRPDVVLPLSGSWFYWEIKPIRVEAAKSP
jgi:hypothetical protein